MGYLSRYLYSDVTTLLRDLTPQPGIPWVDVNNVLRLSSLKHVLLLEIIEGVEVS
jgi:hypothetical protein